VRVLHRHRRRLPLRLRAVPGAADQPAARARGRPTDPAIQARNLDRFTAAYLDYFHRSAIKYNVNVIAGSHLTVEDGKLYNIAYLFHRDGRIDKQYKLHITPAEQRWWGVDPGTGIRCSTPTWARSRS
jgi:predicted amidohydrolase